MPVTCPACGRRYFATVPSLQKGENQVCPSCSCPVTAADLEWSDAALRQLLQVLREEARLRHRKPTPL